MTEKIKLHEVGLARVWQHATEGNVAFGAVSAYRGGLPIKREPTEEEVQQDEINRQRHQKLKKLVKQAGYGFFELDGDYPEEDRETGQTTDRREVSLFIPTPKENAKELYDLLFDLIQPDQFDQDTFLFYHPDFMRVPALVDQKGHMMATGGFHTGDPDKLGDFVSRLRQRRRRAFAFKESFESLIGGQGSRSVWWGWGKESWEKRLAQAQPDTRGVMRQILKNPPDSQLPG